MAFDNAVLVFTHYVGFRWSFLYPFDGDASFVVIYVQLVRLVEFEVPDDKCACEDGYFNPNPKSVDKCYSCILYEVFTPDYYNEPPYDSIVNGNNHYAHVPCDTGQYRTGSGTRWSVDVGANRRIQPGYGPGVCVSCPTCPTAFPYPVEYRSGCSGIDAGTCQPCTTCTLYDPEKQSSQYPPAAAS
ncbi:hypothetical protein GUITHDRAFT_144333 [Guillardia theta CCMP2712]|uniref:Uncharacterized protein n=1 Tax=Guillardia theta (strain CCMP2712) TaxID=905079 RepID=L1IPM6_GUITC|nr:hypothetical protein GUITHDRAFT_144333 [Guillardia theta CCMP2712]EKX38213.1 hypothetical protein GUITHDRAFT_144333 [Guillardia theta CCMP2712]|eukprot:XP_005825193.1 hypothetical protein GUITHDRAFT_144333 [Guillardia theta CCMP2712]